MSADHPNLAQLRIVAESLEELRDVAVFLGGAAVNLLITDEAAPEVRVTRDVDTIVEITSRREYRALQSRLVELGFEPYEGDDVPLCRWTIQGVMVDVMPSELDILGFASQWCVQAIDAAQRIHLDGGLAIRVVTAPFFVATKVEAFLGRGNGGFAASHDLEDLIAVTDGRPELIVEMDLAPTTIRHYLSAHLGKWVEDDRFRQAVAGHLRPDRASQERLPLVLGRLEALSSQNPALPESSR